MQTTEALLGLLRERGKRGLPITRAYRMLYNTNLYLSAYGRVYRNAGAMTPGATEETADGTSLEAQIAEYLAFMERFRTSLQREEHGSQE